MSEFQDNKNLPFQMEKTAESLNWIVKAMIQEQMGTDKAPPVFKSKEQRQREGKLGHIIRKFNVNYTIFMNAYFNKFEREEIFILVP